MVGRADCSLLVIDTVCAEYERNAKQETRRPPSRKQRGFAKNRAHEVLLRKCIVRLDAQNPSYRLL